MAATIKDVAKEVGVSIVTVSHIINDTRYVRPELVEEILQAIRNTNYQVRAGKEPGTARLGEKSAIAVVIPSMEGSLFTRIITYITQLCKSRGCSVSIYLTFDDTTSERRTLEGPIGSRQAAGITIAPHGLDSKYCQKIRQRNTSFVCIEQTVSDHSISYIMAGNKSIIRKGAQTLPNSGHKKIGILMSDREISAVSE